MYIVCITPHNISKSAFNIGDKSTECMTDQVRDMISECKYSE